MYKVLILLLLMIGCTKQAPAPQEWNDWVKSRKESFSKKISTPAAIQFLYLKKESPSFYLIKTSDSYKLSPSKFRPDDISYKLNFQNESLLNSQDEVIGTSADPVKINERIYLKTVFMPEENQVRMFLYDLEKKDLAKKRKRHFFEYKKEGMFEATYTKNVDVKTAKFQRSDGTTRDFNILGILALSNGSKFSVYAEPDQIEKSVMLMFKDSTNGESTYGAGRYLYVDIPTTPNKLKNGDKIMLDFNYTFNPPCAVSEGYHCPLPQDFANFKIESGEKHL
jgi:hypothetical protein